MAEFAREVGASKSAVSHAIKRNPSRIVLVEVDGKKKVDLEQSLIAWNATLQSNSIPRVDQTTKSKNTPKPKSKKKTTQKPKIQKNIDELTAELDNELDLDLTLDLDKDLDSYSPLTNPDNYDEKELQKIRSFLDGKKKESDLAKSRIEREKMIGKLIERESVELFLSAFLTHASAGLKVLPSSVSVVIAAQITALIKSGDFIDENTINSIVSDVLDTKINQYVKEMKKSGKLQL